MYFIGGTGSRGPATTSAALATGGGTLAFTGFPAVGIAILALLAILLGFILVRTAVVSRHKRLGSGE